MSNPDLWPQGTQAVSSYSSRVCPEQDCEQLVFHFSQGQSMIETLEPSNSVSRSNGRRELRASRNGTPRTPEHESRMSRVKTGKAARTERRTNPVEKAFPWRDIGDANVNPDFLYPTSEEHPCPVQQSKKMSKQEAQQYLPWIVKVVPDLDKKSKDERVYCAYCDMNNHPRFSCQFYYKHQNEKFNHQCTLCTGKRASQWWCRLAELGKKGNQTCR